MLGRHESSGWPGLPDPCPHHPGAAAWPLCARHVRRFPGTGRFEALFLLPVKAGGMDGDSETVRQVGLSVGAVLLFILAVAAASTVFGAPPPVDREVSGQLTGTANASGPGLVQTEFEGEFDGPLPGSVEGTLSGAVNETGDFDGQFSGNISGDVDGELDGQVSGTLSNGSFEGTLTGRINGTANTVSLGETGGVLLVVLIAGLILLMAAGGVWLSRQDD